MCTIQQFLAVRAERGERGADRDEPRVEARLTPAGHGVRPSHRERAHAPRVEHREDQQRAELEGGLEVGGDGERGPSMQLEGTTSRERARLQWPSLAVQALAAHRLPPSMRVPRRPLLHASGRPRLTALAVSCDAAAQAHGIVGKADLPIPVWLFSWAAAIVLVVSFVALSTLWRTPQLQQRAPPPARAALPRGARVGSAGAFGVGLFALVLYSGFAGAQVAQRELLGDVHLRDLLGRAAGGERAVRRHVRGVQPVAVVCAGARLGRAGALAPRASLAAPPLRYPRAAGRCGRRSRASSASRGWSSCTSNRDEPSTAGGAVARLLPGDARRDAAVRGRGVERAGGRLRRLLQSALAALGAGVATSEGYLCLRRPLSGLPEPARSRPARSRWCAR